MTLQQRFNQALTEAFNFKKCLYIFIALALSGVIYLLFQAIAYYAAPWIQYPLRYLPLFVIFGFLMALGVFLEKPNLELCFKGSYLAIPLLLAFLLFWVLIGIFLLLSSIPYLGVLFNVVLSFFPFLLNLGTLVLFFIALLSLFFVVPVLVRHEKFAQEHILGRIRADYFTSLVNFVVALIPAWIVWRFSVRAVEMTVQLFSAGDGVVERILQAFFILLPLAALLTPAVLFFFNFAHLSATEE